MGVFIGNMDEGSFCCDVNISFWKFGDLFLVYKVEVKNMNSFCAVYCALEFEIVW